MGIQGWILLAGLLPFVFLLGVLNHLEERDLRRTYRMFGTTGFRDVDRRLAPPGE